VADAEDEGFGELVRYTLPGYLGGLGLAWLFDALGYSESLLAGIVVRTLAGEGESVFEGVYAVRDSLDGGESSMAAAYGWGKLLGMSVPLVVHLGAWALGFDLTAPSTFYIPYFYGMSDQIGASLAGLRHLTDEAGSLAGGLALYLRHPVMLTSLAVVLALPAALFALRASGFAPTTQVKAALETVVANLCWLPPVVGSLLGRRRPAA